MWPVVLIWRFRSASCTTTCNHRKGGRTASEAGMKLRWEPKIPRTSYIIITMGRGPDTWKKYVEIKI